MVRNRSWPAVSHWREDSDKFVTLETGWIAAYYLEFDSFSVEFNCAYLEVDTDCGDE